MITEINYSRQGDYYLPNLKLPDQEPREIGIWGQRRRRYLRNHHRILYYNLLTQCKLIDYLADIDEEAQEMFSRLVKRFAEQEDITEQLKADDPMLWVKRMNNIHNRAEGIVLNENHICLTALAVIKVMLTASFFAIEYCIPTTSLKVATKFTCR